MNSRLNYSSTPEDRLAAVVHALAVEILKNHLRTRVGPCEPDFADYRDALRPYVQRELLLVRIDEARKSMSVALTGRVKELAVELSAIEAVLPKDDRLL